MQNKFNKLVQTDLPRFWDTGAKEMIYPKFVDNRIIAYQIHSNDGDLVWYSLNDMLLDFNSRFIQMKPTGLKDKNGKLIYEGDIAFIEAYEHKVAFIVEAPYSGLSLFNKDVAENIEIIGNIYDNPELLERENVHSPKTTKSP